MNTLKKLFASVVAIGAMSVSYAAPADPRPLPGPTYEAAADRAVSYSALANVQRAIAAHLALWTSPDRAHYPYEALLADDVVYEFPYAAAPSSARIEGKKAIADHLRNVAEGATQWTFSDLKFFSTLEPNVFFVSLNASAVVRETGRPYRQTYVIRVTMDGDKISNLYTLWDQAARATAFGRAD